jgi:hypothetical protein
MLLIISSALILMWLFGIVSGAEGTIALAGPPDDSTLADSWYGDERLSWSRNPP